MDVGCDFAAVGVKALHIGTISQPKRQGMGRFKAVFLHDAQFQTGAHDFQSSNIRHTRRSPVQTLAEHDGTAFGQEDVPGR